MTWDLASIRTLVTAPAGSDVHDLIRFVQFTVLMKGVGCCYLVHAFSNSLDC
jgi:hypothetical protein